MSFLEKIKTSRTDLLFLVRGKTDNKVYWHYIIVNKPNLPLFKIRVKSDFIDLKQYGEIIESGWGENPPADVAVKIKKQYS